MTTPKISIQVSLSEAGNIMTALNSKANELVGIINTIQSQVSAQVTTAQPSANPTPPGDGTVE